MLSEEDLNKFKVNLDAAIALTRLMDFIESYEMSVNEASGKAVTEIARHRVKTNEEKVQRLKKYYKTFVLLMYENSRLLDIIVNDKEDEKIKIKEIYGGKIS